MMPGMRTGGFAHSQRHVQGAVSHQRPSNTAALMLSGGRRGCMAALPPLSASLGGTALRMRRTSSRQRQAKHAVVAAERPGASDQPVKPAYNKYRSRADIERSYLRQWQEVTARGAQGQTRMTLFSALGFLPRWAKYTLVPDFMRFLWWLVWVRICAVAHLIHRAAVKLGARVDALLEGRRSGRRAFSRAMVLRRYHHRVPPWENARYRWRLLQGEAVGSAQEGGHPQMA